MEAGHLRPVHQGAECGAGGGSPAGRPDPQRQQHRLLGRALLGGGGRDEEQQQAGHGGPDGGRLRSVSGRVQWLQQLRQLGDRRSESLLGGRQVQATDSCQGGVWQWRFSGRQWELVTKRPSPQADEQNDHQTDGEWYFHQQYLHRQCGLCFRCWFWFRHCFRLGL